jgi:ABC-type nitrate/sulfonate/bicarbonate transport system substrate-binding protein
LYSTCFPLLTAFYSASGISLALVLGCRYANADDNKDIVEAIVEAVEAAEEAVVEVKREA